VEPAFHPEFFLFPLQKPVAYQIMDALAQFCPTYSEYSSMNEKWLKSKPVYG
jgi:hypothetical protein